MGLSSPVVGARVKRHQPYVCSSLTSSALLQTDGLRFNEEASNFREPLDIELHHGFVSVTEVDHRSRVHMVRVLAGLDRPYPGRVLQQGLDLYSMRPVERARRVALVSSECGLYADLTVKEAIEMGRISHIGLLGMPGEADSAAVRRAVAMACCEPLLMRRVGELPAHDRQLVNLAQALAAEARVLLLDGVAMLACEQTHQSVGALLHRLAHDASFPRLVVATSSFLPFSEHVDRVLVFARGRLCADGPPTAESVQAALGIAQEEADDNVVSRVNVVPATRLSRMRRNRRSSSEHQVAVN